MSAQQRATPTSATKAPRTQPSAAPALDERQASVGNQAVMQMQDSSDPGDIFGGATLGSASEIPYRADMEASFGEDFSGVQAFFGQSGAMQQMGAKAAASGEQVVFEDNNPSKEMVAHELTHVIQSRKGGSGVHGKSSVSTPGDSTEQEADSVATRVASGKEAGQISAGGDAGINRWSGHEHRAMGNLGAIKATGAGTFDLADPNNVRDYKADNDAGDGVLSDLDEQGSAALELQTNGGDSSISYGAASEFSGDYDQNVQELSEEDESGDANGWDWGVMVGNASSNINHFFPLNQNEYTQHHNEAKRLATQAHGATGDEQANLRRQAMLEEGFAAHFLQDSHAAGHMAPRALDRVTVSMLGEGGRGLERSKHWHDALNAPTEGLPTTIGMRFRGDDTMNSSDLEHISTQTGNSLKEIIDTAETGAGSPANATLPAPDYGQIMSDEVYGPIWSAMLGDYEEDQVNAEGNPNQTFTTDGGASSNTVVNDIRENVFGGDEARQLVVPSAEWNGDIVVFNALLNGSRAPEGTEVFIQWFNRDLGYDHLESGALPNDMNDQDDLIGGPDRVALSGEGIGAARGASDDTGDTYAVFYSDAACLSPIGRSNVQGETRGSIDKPVLANGFTWSDNVLSFSLTRDGQAADGVSVYLRWFNEDSANDRDASGNLDQTIVDTDDPVGSIQTLTSANGVVTVTARGDANNSGDTYGVAYMDEQCRIPIGMSGLQP